MPSKPPFAYINKDLEAITKPLRFFLVWPKTNRPEDINILFYLKMLIFYLPFSTPTFLGLIFHVWKAFKDFDLNNMLMDILVVIEGLCLFGMFSVYLYELKTIVRDANNKYSEIINQYKTFDYRKIIKGGYPAVTILLLSVEAYKWITKSNCQKEQINNNSTATCGYAIPKELPFDMYRFPTYEMLLLHEFVVLLFVFGVSFNCIVLMIYAVEKHSRTLEHIQSTIKNLNVKTNMRDDEVLRTGLVNVAKAHNDVIVQVNAFNNACKFINLIHFIMGSMVLALCLLDVIVSQNMENLLQFIGWLASIFVFTLACQTLTDEGRGVAAALSKINWYKMNTQNQRLVLFMLMAAQRPVGIDAGPFKTLCLPTFLTLCKATYSYLNLILNSM